MSTKEQDNAGIPQDVIDANDAADRDLEKFRVKPPQTAPTTPGPKAPDAPVVAKPVAPVVDAEPKNGDDADLQTRIQVLEAELAEGQKQRKKYDQTVGRLGTELRERDERIRQIEADTAALREELAARATLSPAQGAPATEAMFSDEEATEWGKPLLDVMVRIATKTAAAVEARLSGMVKPVTERIEATERRNATVSFNQRVEELAPGFLAANVPGSEFVAWLHVERNVPLVAGSRRIRKELPFDVAEAAVSKKDAAVRSNDSQMLQEAAETLAELYNTFVAEGEQTPGAAETPEAPVVDAGAAAIPRRQPKPAPEPVQARGASGKPAGGKPKMKQSEYVAFMNEAALGGKTPQEVAAYEAECDLAIREKRFDHNG